MRKLTRLVLCVLVFFVVIGTAEADTASDWWRDNCSGQASVTEGRNSPALRLDFGEGAERARIGTPFNITIEGALVEHSMVTASDAQITLGPKMCLDKTTPYGDTGCGNQNKAAQYNFTQTATINGTARNIVVRATNGGVLFPGDVGPSKDICKIVKVEGASNVIDTTPPPSVPYAGKVVDENGTPLAGVTVTPSHAEILDESACPTVTTASNGLYSFSAVQSNSDCFDAERGWLNFKKTDYIGKRLKLDEEFDGVVPLVGIRKICQFPEGTPTPTPENPSPTPQTGLLVNGVTNSHLVMAGSPVTFTISNAVPGQIDVCYQVLRHPNAPDDPKVNVPEATACTDWINNWSSGNGDWQFNTSNNTLVGTFPTNATWNIPGLKVRSSFRKSGTTEVVTAMMTVPKSGESYKWEATGHFSPAPDNCSAFGVSPTPNGSCTTPGMMCKDATYDYTCKLQSSGSSSGTAKAGIVETVQGIAGGIGNTISGIVEGAGNIIGGMVGGISGAVGSFMGWIGSFFSDDNPMIQVLNVNTATVVNATWDGYASKSISGGGYLDFTYYPPTSGNAQVKGMKWSWSKTGGGEAAGKNAYVWLTDQNDILISGDPNLALDVAAGDITSTPLTSGGRYRLHYVFPGGFQFNVSGIQVAPRTPLWNSFDNWTTDSIGRVAFVWDSGLACGGGDDVTFTWSRLGNNNVASATAKVWLTQNGNVVAGNPNTAKPGMLEAKNLEDGGQYVLQYSVPLGERFSMMGTVKKATTTVTPTPSPTPNPGTSDCPAGFQKPSGMKIEQLAGPGNVNRIMNYSGQVVSIPLPAQPHNYTGGHLSIGENPTSPQGWDIDGNGEVEEDEKMRLQVSINKCQGYVDTSPYQVGSSTLRNYCNINSLNGHYNDIRYIFETGSTNLTSKEMVNKYGYCWVGDGGQYYINARWIFPECPHGAATCGFSFQHNAGGYPRSAQPSSASACTTGATYSDKFTLGGEKIVYRLKNGESAATAFKVMSKRGGSTVEVSTTETVDTPSTSHEITISQCPGNFDVPQGCKQFVPLNGTLAAALDSSVWWAQCFVDVGKTYYMNVRPMLQNGNPACSAEEGCDIRVQIQPTGIDLNQNP